MGRLILSKGWSSVLGPSLCPSENGEVRSGRVLVVGKVIIALLRRHIQVVFLIGSAVGLVLGIYYWMTQSLYRIIILYSIFNIVLYWLTGSRRQIRSQIQHAALGSTRKLCAILAVAISAVLMLGTLERLYSRPDWAAMAMLVVFISLVVVSLTDDTTGKYSALTHPWFLLATLAFIMLYMKWSVYVVQPNLMGGPAYATVDAYRDYANAVRILKLSWIHPEEMIGQLYYSAFPVVPLQIATLALDTGLPCNIVHLILAACYEVLGVASALLVAWAVVGKDRNPRSSALVILPVLIVLLQPILVEPAFVLTPLSFTVPLLLLILFLGLRSINRGRGSTRSFYLSILPLVLVTAPMHAASAVLVVILFYAMAFFLNRSVTPISFGVASFALTSFALYLVSIAGEAAPLTSAVSVARDVLSSIGEIMQVAGPNFLSEFGTRYMAGAVATNELDSFLQAVPSALVLAIATVMILRLSTSRSVGPEQGKFVRQDLRSLFLFCGLVFGAGFVGGYVIHPWVASGVETRYFVFPLTPLALLGSTLVFFWIMRNMNTAKRVIVLGLVILFAISAVTSPVFLSESNPESARLIPTQSERAAAAFVSTGYEIDKTGNTQIITDWPFSGHVWGIMYSEHFYDTPPLMYSLISSPIATGHRTIMLSRQYFVHNAFLTAASPYEKPLTEPEIWSHFDRIFDDSSTSCLLGDL
jgi:hypothetical protein